MNETPIQSLPFDAPAPQLQSILALQQLVWPPDAPGDENAIIEGWRAQKRHHFAIYEGETPLAVAAIFAREIFTPNGPLTVGALAGVCVHPEHRGRGWGEAVVRAAFDFLPQLGTSVSLFQTPVPVFYAKLGCRVVDNLFFDGTREDGARENPFWDAGEMIFPASFPWPDGAIDLNGAGY